MRQQRILAGIAIGAIAALLGGCATAAYPTLPDLGGLTQKTLTLEEQRARIKALASAQAAAGATVQPAVLTQPAQ